jgi:hypothetical protein
MQINTEHVLYRYMSIKPCRGGIWAWAAMVGVHITRINNVLSPETMQRWYLGSVAMVGTYRTQINNVLSPETMQRWYLGSAAMVVHIM